MSSFCVFAIVCFFQAWNEVYNNVTSDIYLIDAWKYILGIVNVFKYNHIPLWCYSHLAHAVADHKKNIKLWNPKRQKQFLKFTTSMMKFLKNSLSAYEILLNCNALYFILSTDSFTAQSDGVCHKYQIIGRDKLNIDMGNAIDSDLTQDLESSVSRNKFKTRLNMHNTAKLLDEIKCDSLRSNHPIPIGEDGINITISNDRILIPLFGDDFPEVAIEHNFQSKTTRLQPQGLNLMMNVVKKGDIYIFENLFENIKELKYMDTQWMAYLPYWSDIFGLRSKYRVNQYVELLWKFEKYIYGNKYLRIDAYLSKSTVEQRDAQLQFITRWRDLAARNTLKKGLYPVDTWKSGRQLVVEASSQFDIDLIEIFDEYLKQKHLTRKSRLDDIEIKLYKDLNKLCDLDKEDWVVNIVSADVRKLKGGKALCTSDRKVYAYRKLQSWLCEQCQSTETYSLN